MPTRQCAECGAEYTPHNPQQKYCSRQCARKVSERRYRGNTSMRQAAHAFEISEPVSLSNLMRAKRKPENTSAVRWRIELRRRARADYYALFGK